MVSKTVVVCAECGKDRVRRWETARVQNGLTEEEWPRPVGPEFKDVQTLLQHQRLVH